MARLSRAKILALDKASELLERQARPESHQPRFDPRITPSQFFFQIYNWTKELIYDEPKYKADSRKRDEWLRKVVMKEPYLNGVLHSVISVDKNRGWTITGGRTQVKKYTSLLHNFQAAPDIYGWRSGMSVTSQSYYGADIGAIVEVGRTTKNGGLAGLFTVDSTKCSLTGDMDAPLKYTVSRQGDQYWEPDDYFRVVSMPSTDEVMNGLGFCAISRCIDLAKLLVGIFEHDREKLATKAPKGLLLLKGISQNQWLQSLEENESELVNLEREYYTGVQVIANDGITDIDARLVPLSNLPENFEHKSFTDMIIYGYALAFGYDPREFWPISGGMVGYGAETTVQHKKATGKGGMDFILNFQEKLQEELPETIEFEFEQRDTDAEITEVGLQESKLGVIQQMFATANAAGETLITQLEARQLLAEAQLIPEDWTLQDEKVELKDTEDAGEMIEKSRVQRAIERFPDEDIISYSWPSGKTRMIKRANEPIRRKKSKVLYKKGKVIITDADVSAAQYGVYDYERSINREGNSNSGNKEPGEEIAK